MSKRSSMLASVIRDVIAPALRECPPECEMVTITEIEVSRDFSFADVFLSALKHPEMALGFFEAKRRELQSAVGRLERRKTPKLRFQIDDRAERGSRMDKLLKGGT